MPRRSANFPSLVALALTLGGCATIAGRRQIIAVDSEPRGAAVYVDGEADPVGKTPFFLEVKRSRSLGLTFRAGDYERHREDDCGIRWKGFGLADGAMTALIWPLGLAGIAVDLADGAAWQCDGRIMEQLPGLPATATKACHRYLIVPPNHPDELISDRLALRWIQRQKPALGACDKILSYDEGKTQLEFLNLDNTSDLAPGALDRSLTDVIGVETGATDLVYLRLTQTGGKVMVTPQVEDMLRGTVTEQPPLVFTGRQARSLVETGGRKYLNYSINLLPNSVTYSLSHSTFDIDAKGASAVSNVRDIDTLPQYLTGFSLTDVEHPRGIGAWGLTFHVSPFIMPEYWDLAYDLTDPGGPALDHKTRVIAVIAQYYAGLTAHTPIGAFSLSEGAGPFYFNERHSRHTVNDRVALAVSTDFTYTAFLTDRVYFQSSTWVTQFPRQRLPLDGASLTRWEEASVGLGYFLPTMRSRLWEMIASRVGDDADVGGISH